MFLQSNTLRILATILSITLLTALPNSLFATQGDFFLGVVSNTEEDGTLDFYINEDIAPVSENVTFLSNTYETTKYRLYTESNDEGALGWIAFHHNDNIKTLQYVKTTAPQDFSVELSLHSYDEHFSIVADIAYTKLDNDNNVVYSFIFEDSQETKTDDGTTYYYPFVLNVDGFSYAGIFTETTDTDSDDHNIIVESNANRLGELVPVIKIRWDLAQGTLTIIDLADNSVISI